MNKSNEDHPNQSFYENFFSEEARRSERVVLITGGADRIGEALVRRFAEAGDKVSFTADKDDDRANALAADLETYGVRALPYNQTTTKGQDELLEALSDPVEILIHNSGLDQTAIEALSGDLAEQHRILMAINVVNPMMLTCTLLPGMMENNYGKVVFISMAGRGIQNVKGFRFSQANNMGRAAIANLTQQLGEELRTQRIDPFAIYHETTYMNVAGSTAMDEARGIADLCYLICSTESGRLLKGAVIDVSLGLASI